MQLHNDNKATATLETETDFSRDARAIRERALWKAKRVRVRHWGDEKVYKGIYNYTDYRAGFRSEQTVGAEKAGGAHRPLRASAHIRVSSRFDYQPNICKDYKETGYCGYGDSCKFMHDRGDYKSGWQMEKEWDEAEKTRKRNISFGRQTRKIIRKYIGIVSHNGGVLKTRLLLSLNTPNTTQKTLGSFIK